MPSLAKVNQVMGMRGGRGLKVYLLGFVENKIHEGFGVKNLVCDDVFLIGKLGSTF